MNSIEVIDFYDLNVPDRFKKKYKDKEFTITQSFLQFTFSFIIEDENSKKFEFNLHLDNLSPRNKAQIINDAIVLMYNAQSR